MERMPWKNVEVFKFEEVEVDVTYIGQFVRGLKGFIHHMVLVHLDSKVKPCLQICV